MKANKEIRSEAWRLLWKEGWAGRLLVTGFLLSVVLFGAVLGLYFVYKGLGVESLEDFQREQLATVASGAAADASFSGVSMRMWLGSLFQSFVQHLFSGIAMLGMAAVLVKAVRGKAEGWFAAACTGFQTPFASFWLWFRIQLQMALWMMAALFPSLVVGGAVAGLLGLKGELAAGVSLVVAVPPVLLVLVWVLYRYQLAWFLKAEHADWGAGRCIARSVELMHGLKGRAVSLDCSYWLWILLLIPLCVPNALFGYAITSGTLGKLGFAKLAAGGLSLLLSMTFGMVIYWYIALGHAIFYREIHQE